jgi:hypothetical protein
MTMAKIATLSVDEPVNIDMNRLGQIVSELGQATATEVIGAALEQLALALGRTSTALERGELARAVSHAEQLSRLAWQVGLVTLAAVAVDVGRCAECRDMGALAATAARLKRIGNRSLLEIWDQPDPA